MDSTLQALVALGRRLAVFAGALTALVALLGDVPVRIACLRGALVLVAVLCIARAGRFLLARSLEVDRARRATGARS